MNIKYVFRVSVQLLSETVFVLRRNERDMIDMCIGRHVNDFLCLSVLNEI